MSYVQTQETIALLDGRYELLECIGAGGMADVHRARDLVLERTVAVKLLRAGSDVLTASARARNEIAVLAGLSHPSLVTLLDARLSPGRASYLVMELVPGQTLAERLRSGPLEPAEVSQLARELGSALETVHAAGVVHRDVKPSNVLVAPPSQPGAPFHAKLTDFGVASLMDGTRITAPGVVVGTAAYFAPEQLRGEAVTPAADIYALGLLLLECLTGDRAYPQASGMEAVVARLVTAPNIPDALPEGWRRLLARMTAMDAAARPSAHEVARTAASLAVRPPSSGRRRRPLPLRRRRGGVLASIAVAAALTVPLALWNGLMLAETPAAASPLRDVLRVTAPSAPAGDAATGPPAKTASSVPSPKAATGAVSKTHRPAPSRPSSKAATSSRAHANPGHGHAYGRGHGHGNPHDDKGR